MPCKDWGDFDREFISVRTQVIVSEVEIPNAGIPVEGVHDVASALVCDATVWHI